MTSFSAGKAGRRPAPSVMAALALAAACLLPAAAAAEDGGPVTGAAPGFWEELGREAAGGFRWNVRWLGYGTKRAPAESQVNRDNSLGLSSRLLVSELRPDFSLRLPRLELALKPRWTLGREWWDEGARRGESEPDSDVFVNGWLVSPRPLEPVSLFWSRESMQWGPSFLASPSNPFAGKNGRLSPKEELPGADFAGVVATLGPGWTVSLIGNYGEGRQDWFGRFRRTAALKIDRQTEAAYLSAILSKSESDPGRAGFSASWNAGEAVLLYGEGSGAARDLELLAGASYTFADGQVLALEYFFNESGSASKDVIFLAPPFRNLDYRDLFLRRDYLLAQFSDRDFLGLGDVTVRGIIGLDDGSSAVLAWIERAAGDYLEFFLVAGGSWGREEAELSALLRWSVTAGLELSF